MSGIKGKSGRKPKSRENIRMSLSKKAPYAVQVMSDTAEGINKDRLRYEAAKDIVWQAVGLPKQDFSIESVGLTLETKRYIFEILNPPIGWTTQIENSITDITEESDEGSQKDATK